MTERTRLLIVDDSRIFRSALEEALAGADDIQVVDSVWSGAKALDSIRAHPPDVVTLDVAMPGLDGLETLAAIQQFNSGHPEAPPVGVIMVSAHTQAGAKTTIEALTSGAFDFITKPSESSAEASVASLRQQLLLKVRQFMKHRRPAPFLGEPALRLTKPLPRFALPTAGRRIAPQAVLIAVSTGGPRALHTMLPDLCRQVELPVFIVQHFPLGFTHFLAENLQRHCAHRVIEAEDGGLVQPRTVYFGPIGRHLLVRRSADGHVHTALNEQPPENGFRPSADVLFRSAAAVYGASAVALVLTGMGQDGSAGLGPLKRAGAYVIAQDEATSVVWGMPERAVATGHVDEVLPLDCIPAAVGALIHS